MPKHLKCSHTLGKKYDILTASDYYTVVQRTSITLSILAVLPVFFIEENDEAAYSNTKKTMVNKKQLKRLQRFFTLTVQEMQQSSLKKCLL